MKLTTNQIRSFHNSGFLAVTDPVLDDPEIERLRTLYDSMFAERAGRADASQFDLAGADEYDQPAVISQILHPHRYCPALRGDYVDIIHHVAQQLLGSGTTTDVFHAILKPAWRGAPTSWHQDEAYWMPDKLYRSISIWMPLQEVNEKNGCLWFNNGSHEWEVLEHRSIGNNPTIHRLELVDESVVRDAVACPLPAGGFTIHRNRTAHYAGPNVMGTPRRALVLSSTLPPRPYPAPRRFRWNEQRNTRRKEHSRGDEDTSYA